MPVLHDSVARYDTTDKLKVEFTNQLAPKAFFRDLVACSQQQFVDMKSLCIASYLVLSTTNSTILGSKLI